jgi:hypothetical protein
MVAPTWKKQSGGVARKTAPRRTKEVVEVEPPFRNTRARSRSMSVGAVQTKATDRKGKGKETSTSTVLQPVTEDQDRASELGGRETYEDEEAVDLLLSEGPVGPVDGEEKNETEEEEEEEEDELEILLKARNAQSKSNPLALTRTRSDIAMTPVYVPPSSNLSTPVPASRLRTLSSLDLGLGNFPSTGTRARVVREQKEWEAKRVPYEPPVGTRASAVRESGSGVFD